MEYVSYMKSEQAELTMNEVEKELKRKRVEFCRTPTAETLHPIYFSNAMFTIKLRCGV
jgi:hypothetical protein